MTRYLVTIAPDANEHIWHTASYIAQNASSRIAIRWLEGLLTTIASLEEWPRRFSALPTEAHRSVDVRKMNYGDYLIFYTVNDDEHVVEVVGFRHGARQPEDG